MTTERQLSIAKDSLLLRSVPEGSVDEMLDAAVWKSHKAGTTLFLQGDAASYIHIVISGWVKLFRIAPNGNEALINVFTRGGSFGEAAALRRASYPVSAEAVTECEVMRIPSTALIALVQRNPEASLSIMAATFQHLHSLVAQMEQLKAQTGAQRVAEFLLKLTDCNQGVCIVKLPYDKVLIAGRLGMKPESLSRAFARLRASGVRVNKNHAVIDDVVRLRDYCSQDTAQVLKKAL